MALYLRALNILIIDYYFIIVYYHMVKETYENMLYVTFKHDSEICQGLYLMETLY